MNNGDIEERKLNIMWVKSGSGSPTTRLSVPISWCYHMGISEDDRGVIAVFDYENDEIVIKKA